MPIRETFTAFCAWASATMPLAVYDDGTYPSHCSWRTLAGFHTLNHSMFTLAHDFAARGMSTYADFQEGEFASASIGYSATRHQREVGTGYFDENAKIAGGGASSTTAFTGSTEEAQFQSATAIAH